jgi:thiol-disulfide isomerase/thioredoxin
LCGVARLADAPAATARWIGIVNVALAIALQILAAVVGETPFSDLDFESARTQAQAAEKLLLIDFTASWCPPCKRMDAETWPHERVRAWVAEHALAIQVDVDKHAELAKRFGIEAMPTIVVLRDEDELDRRTGFLDVDQLLAWTADVTAGRRRIDVLRERSRSLLTSEDVDARYELARELLQAGAYEEALAHYLWLWPATRSAPGMGGVRLSYMLSEMAELAKKHEPARVAFMQILQTLQASVEAADPPRSEDWSEWSSLCEHLGEGGRVLAWYEARRDERGRLFASVVRDYRTDQILDRVFDALIDARRYLEAIRLFDNARQRAQRSIVHYRLMTQPAAEDSLTVEQRTQIQAFARNRLESDLSTLHAALLLDGRRDEAADVARSLLATLDRPEARIALVRRGVEITARPEPCFTQWLDEAEAAGAKVKSLRKRLAKLLAVATPVPPGAKGE